MKKIVLVIAVVGLVVAYGLMSLKSEKPDNSVPSGVSSSTATQTAEPEAKTMTITYDENGFSPDMVQIAKGTTVKFVNEMSDMPMWVASDPHPQHTSLPEMDTSAEFQSEVPPANESYTFTFEKMGTWGYHNHSAPEHTATVVVQ